VVKTVRRRRLVAVKHHVVFGSLEAVNHVLAPLGWHINTAFVERINLTICHLTHKSATWAKICVKRAKLVKICVKFLVDIRFRLALSRALQKTALVLRRP